MESRHYSTNPIKALRISVVPVVLLVSLLMLLSVKVSAQNDILSTRITLESKRTTLFDALNTISKKTGYYFVYDSRILQNDRRVKLEAKSDPLETIIKDLLNDSSLKLRVLSRHILIYKEKERRHTETQAADTIQTRITIKGQVWDKQEQKPLAGASISVEGTGIGTISNSEGSFTLTLNRNMEGRQLAISHIGFTTFKLPVELGEEQKTDIYLQPEVVSLQEVVIRRINPEDIINQAIRSRNQHYALNPVYLTTFYREAVQKNSKYLSYAEGIFKVYQPSFRQEYSNPQLKELKSRKVTNTQSSDTLIMKIKGGLYTCMALDIVSTLPDFIDPQALSRYKYSLSDIVTINSRNAYAIYFEQRPEEEEPLFTGTLYIDTEDLTILGADFEINPKYIQKATESLIIQKTSTHKVTPEKFSYSVSYKKVDNTFYVNHSQCTIVLKARKKGRLFSNTYTGTIEMATCNIETKDVTKFSRQETFRPQTVYLDIPYIFDNEFWGDYSFIQPEEKLSEALKRISVKVEKVE